MARNAALTAKASLLFQQASVQGFAENRQEKDGLRTRSERPQEI
jgi:hypothetical protein